MNLEDLQGIIAIKRSLNIGATGSSKLDGAAVDARKLRGDILAMFDVGAFVGSPTSVSLVFAVEDSADGSTFAAMSPAETVTVTTASTLTIKRLTQAHRAHRGYLRCVVTPTFGGGSSPEAPCVGAIIATDQYVPPGA